MTHINIAILGFGVVGSGVKKVIEENHDLIAKRLKKLTDKDFNIHIKKILVRNIEKYDQSLQKIMTEDISDIINDPKVHIVCELIGGDTVAVQYMDQAIKCQKHLVTANKMAIFNQHHRLFCSAKENSILFKYEAAVAGALPVIKMVEESLISDEVLELSGILNGSTNYVLTKLKEGLSQEEAMKLAKEKGYLEADPSSDILGFDPMYKLGILAHLLYGEFPDEAHIKRVGIDTIDSGLIEKANKDSKKIKLIASIRDKGKSCSVGPKLIGPDNPLYHVDGSQNGILLKCKNAGDIFISGAGAGSRETAVSVVADIASIILHAF